MPIALTRIPGIGPSTAKVLIENGFKSAQQLADSTIAQLAAVPGFGAARASRTINAAIASLSVSGGAAGKAAIPQTAARQRRTARKPTTGSSKSITTSTVGAKADAGIKETKVKKMTKKEQEKLEKAKAKKAAAKKAAAKKAAAKKAAAKKAAAKKAAAKKVAAKKVAAKKAAAKKAAAKKAAAKKVAAKKAKEKKAKEKKAKAKKPKARKNKK